MLADRNDLGRVGECCGANHMFVTFGSLSVDKDVDSDSNGTLDGNEIEGVLQDQIGSGGGKFVPANYGDQDSVVSQC